MRPFFVTGESRIWFIPKERNEPRWAVSAVINICGLRTLMSVYSYTCYIVQKAMIYLSLFAYPAYHSSTRILRKRKSHELCATHPRWPATEPHYWNIMMSLLLGNVGTPPPSPALSSSSVGSVLGLFKSSASTSFGSKTNKLSIITTNPQNAVAQG